PSSAGVLADQTPASPQSTLATPHPPLSRPRRNPDRPGELSPRRPRVLPPVLDPNALVGRKLNPSPSRDDRESFETPPLLRHPASGAGRLDRADRASTTTPRHRKESPLPVIAPRVLDDRVGVRWPRGWLANRSPSSAWLSDSVAQSRQ